MVGPLGAGRAVLPLPPPGSLALPSHLHRCVCSPWPALQPPGSAGLPHAASPTSAGLPHAASPGSAGLPPAAGQPRPPGFPLLPGSPAQPGSPALLALVLLGSPALLTPVLLGFPALLARALPPLCPTLLAWALLPAPRTAGPASARLSHLCWGWLGPSLAWGCRGLSLPCWQLLEYC